MMVIWDDAIESVSTKFIATSQETVTIHAYTGTSQTRTAHQISSSRKLFGGGRNVLASQCKQMHNAHTFGYHGYDAVSCAAAYWTIEKKSDSIPETTTPSSWH
jgi:hypothetical protein